MQYINNDMDDLFRKAAESYPLKTGEGNWDAVSSLLPHQYKGMPIAGKRKKKFLLFFVFLFLFMSIAGILIFVFEQKGYPVNDTLFVATLKSPDRVQEIGAVQIKVKDKYQQGINEGIKQQVSNLNPRQSPKIFITADKSIKNEKEEKLKNTSRNVFGAENALFRMKIKTPGVEKMVSVENNEVNIFKPQSEEEVIVEDAHRKISDDVKNLVNETPASAIKSAGVQSERDNKKRGIKLYAGLQGGPQWNQVSGQGFDKTGMAIGVIVGASICKHLSVETGLYYSRKYYYSDGKYFHMKNQAITMPANMEIINLEGRANIYEIPVKLKYDLLYRVQSNWFITSGVTSYILKKESNDYHTRVNGQEQDMKASYGNQKNYLSAAAQFSIGYEWRKFKNIKIRVEPYLQIPVKGIGVGSMRVFTSGMHIGITRAF